MDSLHSVRVVSKTRVLRSRSLINIAVFRTRFLRVIRLIRYDIRPSCFVMLDVGKHEHFFVSFLVPFEGNHVTTPLHSTCIISKMTLLYQILYQR